MSVQRVVNLNTITVTPPNLPAAPNTYSQIYITGLTNVLRLFFTQLTTVVNSNTIDLAKDINGTVTFSTSTTVNVTFSTDQTQSNAAYSVALSGNAAGYCWVTNKLATGFTINCSANNSNSTDWVVSG